jgi:para-aminobenzoate synthetase component 1
MSHLLIGVAHVIFAPMNQQRSTARRHVADLTLVKRQILFHTSKFEYGICLDNNSYKDVFAGGSCELLAGFGHTEVIEALPGQAFDILKKHRDQHADWLFGGLSYDLKAETENLPSSLPDGVDFPVLCFFRPETVVLLQDGQLVVHCLTADPESVCDEILSVQTVFSPVATPPPVLKPRMPRDVYLDTVKSIIGHIQEGDLYEMNLCQEFYAENAIIDPPGVYSKLNEIAQPPMAAFFRCNNKYLLCASPERFLRLQGNKLVSQPIKGTRRHTGSHDESLKTELANSIKDRAENVMIVDLVRNDLARSCHPGSVRVEELFGVYSFRTVHQMISTVSGIMLPYTSPVDAIARAFPPGSMTGAPKVMAMKLIERYEMNRRGLYSGAVGYFDPAGNFDFNVVIRSLLYNADTGYLSAQVGGAIVYDSVPESEYDECMIKAEALFKAIASS